MAALVIAEILVAAPVLPVLTFRDEATAMQVCGALVRGGIGALEVTLRTPAAMDVLRALRGAFPDVPLGAGTVTRAEQLPPLIELGIDFVVTPGLTPSLADALTETGIAALPGVATAGEAMQARDRGFEYLKLFPARAIGGADALEALGAVLPEVRFCPTGGVRRDELRAYLGIDCVCAVGGSWLADPELVRAGDLSTIEGRACEDMAVARALV